jgi:Domain of unknown function (DUF1338)
MKPEKIKEIWESLWQEYINRVSYARTYQEMIVQKGGTIANDHIAFRSLRLDIDTNQGKINLGIKLFEPLLNNLGYKAAGEYTFPETHLYARHYQHPQQAEYDLPKLFISELIVEELSTNIAEIIQSTVSSANLEYFTPNSQLNPQKIFTRPWKPPLHSVIETVNHVSQYGAWILLHGYAANHFTGYVNRQNTPQYLDIDSTALSLSKLGVPMKAEIEGDIAVGLRQTATHAVSEMVTVIDDETQTEIQIPWTYAYYEIAQRYFVEVEPGKQELFDAFLGRNAQNLFEMTRLLN